MSSTITPTIPMFSSPISSIILATANIGSRHVVDLTVAWYARLFPRIGRRVATAPTNPANIICRPTLNSDVGIHPSGFYSRASTIVAAIATTLNGNTSIGATTSVVTSGTSLVAGDIVCISDTGATAVEFARVAGVSGTTVTFDSPLKKAHTSGDAYVTMADVFAPITLPGGDKYEIIAENQVSGVSIAFECDIEIFPSYIST